MRAVASQYYNGERLKTQANLCVPQIDFTCTGTSAAVEDRDSADCLQTFHTFSFESRRFIQIVNEPCYTQRLAHSGSVAVHRLNTNEAPWTGHVPSCIDPSIWQLHLHSGGRTTTHYNTAHSSGASLLGFVCICT